MSSDSVSVTRWSDAVNPSESAIREQYRAEGLRPYQWSNGPGDVYGAHSHTYHKVIYVLQGSITFGLPEEGRELALRAGDRLDLPPGILHDAVVGPEGVVCLEAHR